MVKVFSTTPRIVMGPGSVKTIGAEVKALGIKKGSDRNRQGGHRCRTHEVHRRITSRLQRSNMPSSTGWSRIPAMKSLPIA